MRYLLAGLLLSLGACVGHTHVSYSPSSGWVDHSVQTDPDQDPASSTDPYVMARDGRGGGN